MGHAWDVPDNDDLGTFVYAKNHGLCPKDDGFYTKDDGFYTENDERCTKQIINLI